MNLEANDLMLFAKVVDEGSFSRAADKVGLPKSTVSRRIATLESQLGERLLLRTTRKLTITDFGHSVLEHANQVLAETIDLLERIAAEPGRAPLLEAIADGTFGLMKRPADGGRGLDGVAKKADGFFNPAMDLLEDPR